MTALQIYQDVMCSLQNAEELGGPEGREYIELMKCIATICTVRANNAEHALAEREGKS